jgi:hypothetical protein
LDFFHNFHIFSQFSSVFSLSFHYFLPYFSSLFTWIVKRYGKYRRKVSWIVKWYEKIWKKIVKWYGKYGKKVSWIVIRYGKYSFIISISFHNFLLYFPYLFTIFFRIFHLFSLFSSI